jgi:thiamine biosynthesis lipoprotein
MSRSFRAMGVEVVVGGAERRETAVRELFVDWDRTFSRFRADSELTRVNRSAAGTVLVSARFAEAVATALAAAAATDGLVDPTLGVAMEAAGYDRDFGELGGDRRPPGRTRPGVWRSLRLAGRALSRPPGVVLDLNGVVKGSAVDAALALFPGRGLVSAGGDLAVRGGTTVALADRGTVRLERGGLATSGTTKRAWSRGGLPQHHLLDPRTGRPATSRWREVTVAAGSCVAADVAAKAAFLLSDDGPDWLEERGLPGRFLGGGGSSVVANAPWREALACS